MLKLSSLQILSLCGLLPAYALQNDVSVWNPEQIMPDAGFNGREYLGSEIHILFLAPHELAAVASQQISSRARLIIGPDAVKGDQLPTPFQRAVRNLK